MLRVLLCMTCCSAPPARSRRPSTVGNRVVSGEKSAASLKNVDSKTDFKSLITLTAGEKNQLLASQVQLQQQDNEDDYDQQNNLQGKLQPKPTRVSAATQTDFTDITDISSNNLYEVDSIVQNQLSASTSYSTPTTTDTIVNAAATSVANYNIPSGSSSASKFSSSSLLQQQHLMQQQQVADLNRRLSSAAAAVNSGGTSQVSSSNYVIRAAYDAYADLDDNIDNESISPPSSIDIGQFTEHPTTGLQGQIDRLNSDLVSDSGFAPAESSVTLQNEPFTASSGGNNDATSEGIDLVSSRVNVPSTTKIGDYARLEYSPVEDLESVTTMSYSRVGSVKSHGAISGFSSMTGGGGGFGGGGGNGDNGGNGLTGGGGGGRMRGDTSVSRAASSAPISRANSMKTTDESISRRSSQGVESTSISIASQLSTEHLQQNLTNMLETANSPIPLFGTIGLPLGPPLNDGPMMIASETAKTSPETTGAALTSASQDSLSDASLGNGMMGGGGSGGNGGSVGNSSSLPRSRPVTMLSVGSTTGGNLVSSMEDSVDLSQAGASSVVTTASTEIASSSAGTTSGVYSKQSTISRITESSQQQQQKETTERVESPLSMMSTATSGGLTNPTPTPSEMSTSSQKKKSKLKAKSLLKRFKGGSKKAKNKDGSNDETSASGPTDKEEKENK